MDVAFLCSNVQPLALKWQVTEGDPKQSTRNTIIKLKETSCILIMEHREVFISCTVTLEEPQGPWHKASASQNLMNSLHNACQNSLLLGNRGTHNFLKLPRTNTCSQLPFTCIVLFIHLCINRNRLNYSELILSWGLCRVCALRTANCNTSLPKGSWLSTAHTDYHYGMVWYTIPG